MKVRLSSNESPFGPSPDVIDVLQQGAGSAHLYPDDQSTGLREAVAAHDGVDPGRVAAGNGSAGILMDLLALETRGRHDDPGEVLTYERAFIVYKLGAQVARASLLEAPLGPSYSRDPEALLERVTDTTRIVCLDNPANPTGDHIGAEALRRIVTGLPDHVTIVVDEAYHHYASGQRDYATVAELGLDHPRLVIVRTFSKAYALAGLRVGYMIGPEELVSEVDTARVRFNVNRAGQAAAVAALGDEAHLSRTVEATIEGRHRMVEGLADLGVPCVDGLGNFLLVELGEPSARIVQRYADHGVGVRPLAPYRLDEQIRVTVGTPEEVDAFLEVSRDVLADVASRS